MMRALCLPQHRRAACRRPPASRGRGVSLVEVLMAIVLLSVGVLGLVGLQARATQYSIDAEDNNRAAMLANELASTMWLAHTTSLPAATITAWNTRVADAATNGLPNGAGSVSVAAGVATITISWHAPSAPSGTSHQYQTQVLMP